MIGLKLRELAKHHQVLCITHLPQIAAYADRHLTVRKHIVADQAQTSVRSVEGAERIEELGEMIGGARISDVTRAQANEMLSSTAPPVPARPNRKSKSRAAAAR